jgi:MYXO-CTERM domain-containing protein
MCNEAVLVSTSYRVVVAVLPDGRMLATTPLGLLESGDRGCSWRMQPQVGAWQSTSLVQSPSDPNHLYLATYAMGETGLRASSDGGQTWHMLLHAGDTDFLRYLQIARGDEQRMYMAKVSFGTSKYAYHVLRSDDAGATWSESAVELSDDETDLEILGVSPFDPQLVIVKAHANDQVARKERLLVSHDGGQTFDTPIMLHVLTAVEWSADRKTLWLATDDGLYRSTDDAHSFERVGVIDLVSCVVEHDGMLLACGWYDGLAAGHPGIGVSADGGETFQDWMQLDEVLQPVQCDASTPTGMTCEALWTDWQREILGPVSVTPPAGGAGGMMSVAAGRGEAGMSVAPQGGAPAPAARSSGGCSVSPAHRSAWSLGLLLLGLFATRRLRTRSAS